MGEGCLQESSRRKSLQEEVKTSQIHFLANNLLHVISKLLIVFEGNWGLWPPLAPLKNK